MLSRATQLVVLDFESLATEFDVEAAGSLHVEGQHLVVDVPTQRRRHRHLAAQRAVQAQADVVAVLDLDHEMDDAARRFARHERQAVVARVDAEEAQPRRRVAVGWAADQLRWQAHRVAQPEAEHVAVEVQGLGIVVAVVSTTWPRPCSLGDELVAVGADDPAVLQCARRGTPPGCCPTGSSKTIISSTRRSASLGGRAPPCTACPRRRAQRGSPAAQRHSAVSQPDCEQPVVLAGHDHQPGGELVHAQIQRALGAAPEPSTMPSTFSPYSRHAGDVGRLDAQVPQRPDAHCRHSSEEIDGQLVELVELLQLRPVAALPEHVQLHARESA